jgi:D-alanyl-D-alanine carboxypeptidase
VPVAGGERDHHLEHRLPKGHGGDTVGHRSTAVATADGRRTAVTDATAEPADAASNAGVEGYVSVVVAADASVVCEMLGKPAPAGVTASLKAE